MRGRTPALATVVEYHEQRVYPLSAFTPATGLEHGEDPDWDEFPEWEQSSSDFRLSPPFSRSDIPF